jgi:N-acetylneuraminic acid mutarotase
MPQPMDEVGAATAGGKVYVVGGQTSADAHADLAWRYDPASGTWRPCAHLPVGLSHPAVTALHDKIYVFGGFRTRVHRDAQDSAFVYDPARDRWTALPPMPRPLGSAVAAALDGTIHVIGGRGTDRVTVATHAVFDPRSGRWSQAAPLPVARDHAGIAVLDGKIHVFGGRTDSSSQNLADHDVFDPRTGLWSKAAPLPRARSSGAFAVLDHLILYVGGECKVPGAVGAAQSFDDVTAYDPRTDRWTTLPPLAIGRHAFAAATVGHVAYFAAGATVCGDGYTSELLTLRLR